ncbi:MAG: hypothetical protein GY801_51635 [bacterium]|nr:hypothetical protein [bacterium]
MNSKERVMLTMSHQKADRVPINFRATQQIAQRLAKSICSDYLGILYHYNVDFREIVPPYIGPRLQKAADGSDIDLWGVGRKIAITESGNEERITINPLKDATTPDDIKQYNWPKAEWFDFSQVKPMCQDFKNYAISTPGLHIEGYHGVFHLLTYLIGMEKAMMDLAVHPELIQTCIDEIMTFYRAYYERFFESAGGMVDFLFYKDDFGSQNSLLIGRKMFMKFFHPNIKALSDLAANFGAKMILHSCGSVMKLIPDFISAGVAVLDPIQVTAKDMDIRELKRRFGQELTFHGGIDVQHLMPYGSIEEIQTKTHETIEVLGEHGGYFFSPSHRFQPDTPIEKIKALYEAVLGHDGCS